MKQHRGLTEAKSRRTLLNMTTLLTRKDGSLLVPVQTPPSHVCPLEVGSTALRTRTHPTHSKILCIPRTRGAGGHPAVEGKLGQDVRRLGAVLNLLRCDPPERCESSVATTTCFDPWPARRPADAMCVLLSADRVACQRSSARRASNASTHRACTSGSINRTSRIAHIVNRLGREYGEKRKRKKH